MVNGKDVKHKISIDFLNKRKVTINYYHLVEWGHPSSTFSVIFMYNDDNYFFINFVFFFFLIILIIIFVCLEAHIMHHKGVPPGITASLARECL